jgi:hypothetical protein
LALGVLSNFLLIALCDTKAKLCIFNHLQAFFLPESKTLAALLILGLMFQPFIFLLETFEVEMLFPLIASY